MNTIAKVIGLDIAKSVFVVVVHNEQGKIVLKKKLFRSEVLPTFANMAPTKGGIEACAKSHYCARQLKSLCHDVILIAAQHTRAYVTGNKTIPVMPLPMPKWKPEPQPKQYRLIVKQTGFANTAPSQTSPDVRAHSHDLPYTFFCPRIRPSICRGRSTVLQRLR